MSKSNKNIFNARWNCNFTLRFDRQRLSRTELQRHGPSAHYVWHVWLFICFICCVFVCNVSVFV